MGKAWGQSLTLGNLWRFSGAVIDIKKACKAGGQSLTMQL